MTDSNDKIYFAQTNFRNQRTTFGVKQADRTKHLYVIGKTGMGKTTLLENMAVQDIRKGNGLAIVDPHGAFAEKMLSYVPEERIKDVIYFNPADTNYPIAFNIMEDVGPEQRHLVASGLMGVFKKMWPDVWSARMEYILNNSILALLEYPGSTLLGVNRMLADKEYRKEVVSKINDPVVKAFWEQEFAKYTERFSAEATPAIQNKVGQFTSNPLIRNIIGQPKSSFDFREVMDNKKIVIMNLSKGKIGELNSQLIGAMLITKIYLAAMSRASDTEKQFSDFYLYVDEFQNFATESFKDILSEARKYGLALVLAHQYIAQMDEKVRDAVFGNVGTHIVFRVGPADAEVLETEFSPEFVADDIVNLGFASIYLKLSIDGVPSRPFSATTLPPIDKPEKSYKEEIVEFSRQEYCGDKEKVESIISSWHAPKPRPPRELGLTGDAGGEKEEKHPPELYEAACSVCDKKTLVPFKPDGKRPVFCAKHRSYLGDREAPRTDERKVSQRESGIVSLREMGQRTTQFRKEERPRKEKSKPDFKGLRELLEETGVMKKEEKKEENREKEKENILKPGESVKF